MSSNIFDQLNDSVQSKIDEHKANIQKLSQSLHGPPYRVRITFTIQNQQNTSIVRLLWDNLRIAIEKERLAYPWVLVESKERPFEAQFLYAQPFQTPEEVLEFLQKQKIVYFIQVTLFRIQTSYSYVCGIYETEKEASEDASTAENTWIQATYDAILAPPSRILHRQSAGTAEEVSSS